MLTFEWDENQELLEIHGNFIGLMELRNTIDSLIESCGSDHIHLMIPSWGGEELTEEKQCQLNVLIPHVKIFKWEE